MPTFVRIASVLLILAGSCPAAQGTPLPKEPMEIGTEPQFFVDDYLVDNRWGLLFQRETVQRAFHPPKKDPRNPLLQAQGGYVNVVFDAEAKKFRMWYQDFWLQSDKPPLQYTYAVAYAESKDGISWHLPNIGKFAWKGSKENNIVLRGPDDTRASGAFLVDVPPKDRRGYRYVLLYACDRRPAPGLRLIGSKDGIDWDLAGERIITPGYAPDTQTSLCWDPRRQVFVCFTRATDRYSSFPDRRRVARLASKELWAEWAVKPQNMLIPDEQDARLGRHDFYGMPTRYYGGLYWGFLWPYRLGWEVVTELAVSRDGEQFERFRSGGPLVDLGPKGAFDAGMVFASGWLEVGEEWWIYYWASDGRHDDLTRKSALGLAKVKKERLVSLHTPPGGGQIVTRTLKWPGGNLLVNANTGEGELKIRVTDERRKVIPGFDFADARPVKGDRLAHEIQWGSHALAELKDQVVRLEFLFTREGDLYTFRAE